MIKQIISRGRADLQLLYHSRLQLRSSGILLNSLPKSGTHLIKAILQGMGHEFCGHYGAHSKFSITLTDGAKGFYTAHTRKPLTGPGHRILCVRDPGEVALSLVHYTRSRQDHYLNNVYRDMPLAQALEDVFAGSDAANPLAKRYESFDIWAEQSEAETVDFADIRSNPAIMAELIGSDGFDTAAVLAEISKPNPTKRKSNRGEEHAFLQDFLASHSSLVKPCYDIYHRSLGRRAYAF